MRSRVFAVAAAGLLAAGCGAGHRRAHLDKALTSSAPARTLSTSTRTSGTAAPASAASITGPPPPERRASAVAYITGGRGPAGVRLNGRRMSVAGGHGATSALVAPSGQLVAIASASGAALQLDRRDGSAYLRMPTAASSVVPLAWSPDSRYLALSLRGGSSGSTFEVLDTRTGAVTVKQSGRADRASFASGRPVAVFFDLDRSHIAGHPSPDLWSAIVTPDGEAGPITHDGMSAEPLHIRAGIVYDAIEDLSQSTGPFYQLAIWGRSTIRPVDDAAAAPAAGGLVPVAASADGRELVAAPRRGSGVYLVDSVTRRVRAVSTASSVTPVGISRDGRQLLVTVSSGTQRSAIATMPTAGGSVHVIARGASQPSWNR